MIIMMIQIILMSQKLYPLQIIRIIIVWKWDIYFRKKYIYKNL